jgi:hypothetical protein
MLLYHQAFTGTLLQPTFSDLINCRSLLRGIRTTVSLIQLPSATQNFAKFHENLFFIWVSTQSRNWLWKILLDPGSYTGRYLFLIFSITFTVTGLFNSALLYRQIFELFSKFSDVANFRLDPDPVFNNGQIRINTGCSKYVKVRN